MNFFLSARKIFARFTRAMKIFREKKEKWWNAEQGALVHKLLRADANFRLLFLRLR